MRKIELTNEDGTQTIEIAEDIQYLGDYIDFLVRPVLLAAGFSNELIKDYIGE